MRALVLIIVLAAAAQDAPDFSGRWLLVSSEPSTQDAPRALVVQQARVRANVRGEPMKPFFKSITIEREFPGTTRSETRAIGVIGGFVSGVVGTGEPGGPRTHHAVKWDGNALVFEGGSYSGEAAATRVWAERREVWSFDPDGRLRITTTTRGSTDVAGTTVTLIYRRP
jgi:hypothetical protein